MAWTAPRTWVDGELVTAALMNTHVRDNQLALSPHLIVRKTSDQSVTSSTVLVNDTALVMAVAANEVWHVRWSLIFSAVQSSGDIRVAFTFPAGGEVGMTGIFLDNTAAAAAGQFEGTTTPTAVRQFLGPVSSTAKRFVAIEGVFINAGTAGNLQLQFAQGTSNGTATIMRTNSTLWAVKLA